MTSDELRQALAANRESTETLRRLSDESVDALRSAGLLRLAVPKHYGGEERDFRDIAAAVFECARECASTGWVLMVSSAHDWIIGSFDPAAQDEVWREGPDAVTPGALAPSGVLTRVDDGFRLQGRFSFNSGCAHGKWFLLGCMERSDDGVQPYHVVVPVEDLTLDDNWHTLGLRGTGSIDVVAHDIFVPSHRAMDSRVLAAGSSQWGRTHESAIYSSPMVSGLSTLLSSAVLGIGESAFAASLDLLLGQSDKYTSQKKLDRPGLHLRLAESRAELTAAAALVGETLELLQPWPDIDDADAQVRRARIKFQSSYSFEMCRRSGERLMAAAGGRAAFDDSALQRAFRDLTMAAKHEMVNFDNSALAYGRSLVGLDLAGQVI
ncbi:MAG: acyl-CoA dehydrogenase family protein [Gammaproteobacteria bacterium]|nr:acyl-CoA dehydrogenase family protein [Gammaproteobacteria bacterium]